MDKNNWIYACKATDMPHNGGVCVQYGTEQIALYYFTHRNEWYATQNLCPHKKQMALSRGMLGSQQGEPKVACPFHKKTFSLKNGQCLNDEACSAIKTYPVKVHEGNIFINVASILTPHSSTPIAYEPQ
ncbi:nitrite reductase small subunit NirD [Niabella drilacis]|uniref:Nitrite reductase (NADH) small subunit n=1 Tax=Niabella drilacis (strain DSM 25811 / CCM 8410 / CCUG 62505 / LMG 26954 / E90) TaxID=1285928 RepID=A0A1G6SD51_NIADE|nr:nitrite reductase small subunit NirD [Niabella drilacis]SDD14802.1 nitrite reductase (NADH) small subunit [Niabella drilacis]